MSILTKRTVMFGGKGGVGKTTCAAATALHCALQGQRTIVISTDPTPSLADIFEIEASEEKPAKVADNLWFSEVGLEEIKGMWDQKFGREVYEVFSAFVDVEYEAFSEFITSILPGLAEEFMLDYIRELSLENTYDRIIWDTAPLGQTLGLLKTPGMLREHLRPAPRIYSRLRTGEQTRRPILEIIRSWDSLSQHDMAFLQNDVAIVLVVIPEALAVGQLERILGELKDYGLSVGHLIVNSVVVGPDADFLVRKSQQQQKYREFLHKRYDTMKISEIPMFPQEVKGIPRLKEVGSILLG